MGNIKMTDSTKTLPIREISIATRLEGIQGFIQRAINDNKLLMEALEAALKVTSVNDKRFHISASQTYLNKVTEDIATVYFHIMKF